MMRFVFSFWFVSLSRIFGRNKTAIIGLMIAPAKIALQNKRKGIIYFSEIEAEYTFFIL